VTYNALDNLANAKRFREQLILEKQDIQASISYDAATSWCDDCPARESSYEQYYSDGWPRRVAPTCCKDDGTFDEQYAGAFAKIEQIEKLLRAISAYLGEEIPS
jgi:hypothetical protein